jgi:DNA adenine methylase
MRRIGAEPIKLFFKLRAGSPPTPPLLGYSSQGQPSHGHPENKGNCLPFLKWAGGKRWLVNHCLHLVPAKIKTYIEPFLGSGAMYFALQPRKAILADVNLELIQTYLAIKSDWKSVAKGIRKHHVRHSRDYYYRVRSSSPTELSERAARLVYLNRTCWNGLYRVNRQGQFNVPIGTKTQVCLTTDDFERVHRLLSGANLVRSDFERVIKMAKSGDFLFVDPPYTTLHSGNGFVKYNEKLFSWSDQVRLRDCLLQAQERGVFFIATNADHHSIRQLYSKGFCVRSVRRASLIAADSDHRQSVRELLITPSEVRTT